MIPISIQHIPTLLNTGLIVQSVLYATSETIRNCLNWHAYESCAMSAQTCVSECFFFCLVVVSRPREKALSQTIRVCLCVCSDVVVVVVVVRPFVQKPARTESYDADRPVTAFGVRSYVPFRAFARAFRNSRPMKVPTQLTRTCAHAAVCVYARIIMMGWDWGVCECVSAASLSPL